MSFRIAERCHCNIAQCNCIENGFVWETTAGELGLVPGELENTTSCSYFFSSNLRAFHSREVNFSFPLFCIKVTVFIIQEFLHILAIIFSLFKSMHLNIWGISYKGSLHVLRQTCWTCTAGPETLLI